MRPGLTWIIVGAVVAVGVFAGLDALRSSDEPPLASAERDQAVPTAPSPQPSFTLEGRPEEAPMETAVGEPMLDLRLDRGARGDDEVAVYADGRVIWEINDGNPGYLQMRLTPEGVERLRSRAVSTGLFEQNQGLTLDPEHHPGSMEVRHGDRSVILVWGDRSAVRSWAKQVDFERISAASAEVENEVIELVMLFRDPTAWRLPRRMYVRPEASPFVPSRLVVVYDLGEPDWSTLPSPAREVVSANLQTLISDGCQVISTDQAWEMARALTQTGIHGGYDGQRGLFGFEGAGSLVHSRPALPHEVACEDR
jgi:hypothetical protein